VTLKFSNSEALGGIDEPKVAAVSGGKVDIEEASGLTVADPALIDLGVKVADITERGGGPTDPEVDEAERMPGAIKSGLGERDLGGYDPAL